MPSITSISPENLDLNPRHRNFASAQPPSAHAHRLQQMLQDLAVMKPEEIQVDNKLRPVIYEAAHKARGSSEARDVVAMASICSRNHEVRQFAQNLLWENWSDTVVELLPLYHAINKLYSLEESLFPAGRSTSWKLQNPEEARLAERRLNAAYQKFLLPLIEKPALTYWVARQYHDGKSFKAPSLQRALRESPHRAELQQAIFPILSSAVAGEYFNQPLDHLAHLLDAPLLLNANFEREREALKQLLTHPRKLGTVGPGDITLEHLAANAVTALALVEHRDTRTFLEKQFFRHTGSWGVQYALSQAIRSHLSPEFKSELESFLCSSMIHQATHLLMHGHQLFGEKARHTAKIQAALALIDANPALASGVFADVTHSGHTLNHQADRFSHNMAIEALTKIGLFTPQDSRLNHATGDAVGARLSPTELNELLSFLDKKNS